MPLLRSFSERWLFPNARCPVCGASVFFYSNEYGSRVFFDEVGPPWPKHPCTDTAWQHQRFPSVGRTAPARYATSTGRRMMRDAVLLDSTSNRALTPVGQAYGVDAWTPYAVLGLRLEQDRTLLTLRELYTGQPAAVWLTPSVVSLVKGDVVFIKQGQMSYFDLARGVPVFTTVVCLGPVVETGVWALLRTLWSRLTDG